MSTVVVPGLRVQDRYELLERLDDYGRGDAWKAKDHRARGQTVVVKFLRARAAGMEVLPDALDLHLTRLRGVRHGHILPTLGHGAHERRPFVVMEWRAGRSLAAGLPKRLEDEPPPIALLERLFDCILAALEAAHGAREPLLHGGLDPRSVVVLRVGERNFELRVQDIGLAPYADWSHGQQEFHALTRRNAPEAKADRAHTLAEEIFGVGELARVLFGRVPNYQHPRDDLPAAVWGLVQRATAEHPEARYASVTALREDFKRRWTERPPPMEPVAETVVVTTAPTAGAGAAPASPPATAEDLDATVLVVPGGEGAKPARPRLANLPQQVLARAHAAPPDPSDEMTVRVLPKLKAPPAPQAAALLADSPSDTMLDDSTVRVEKGAIGRSAWDPAGLAFVAAPAVSSDGRVQVVSHVPPRVDGGEQKRSGGAARTGADDEDAREAKKLKVALGVIVAVLAALFAAIAVVLARG